LKYVSKIVICFFPCLLCISFFAFSQENSSFEKTIPTLLKSSLSSDDQNQLKDYLDQLKVAEKAVDSAEIFNEISTLYLKSSYYLGESKYDTVLHYANKTLKLCQHYINPNEIKQYLTSLERIGAVYNNTGNFSKAIHYFSEILKIIKNISNAVEFIKYREVATTYLAIFYENIENYEMAIKQFELLFEFIEKNNINSDKITSIPYLYTSRFYRKKGDIKTAYDFAIKAKQVATKNNRKHRVAMAYLELAQLNYERQKNEVANSFLEKSFLLLNETEYVRILTKYYFLKAKIAEQNNDLSGKIYNARKAYQLLNKNAISQKHLSVYKLLHSIYKEEDDFKKAHDMLEQIMITERKLFNNEQLRKSALLEIKRRDQDIELVEGNSKVKSKIILGIILLLILGFFVTIYIYKDRKKKIKLAQEIDRKNKQLKQLDTLKSNFFSNITHELQTPLTLISGPLEQVLKEHNCSLDTTVKAKLQMVSKNTKSLKVLVNDILDLSKLKDNKLTLNQQIIALYTFLNSLLQKFTPLAKQKKIDYQFCIESLENYDAIIDRKKLEKIVNNLVLNAIKYTPINEKISVLVNLEDENLIFSVKDTGIGISQTDMPYIFNRFFQGSDNSESLEGGFGIGLSLVKELVALMNGTITVESELSKGSNFTVKIPLENVHKKTAITHEDVLMLDMETIADEFTSYINNISQTIQKHTILIVEDHQEMQQYIGSILHNKCHLVIATNGQEALKKLQTTAVDLIISDVMMPAMDGFTLLETLKESETYREIPVIMLTALSDISYKLKALTIGVDDYLTKPFVADELLARIYNLLQRYQRKKDFKKKDLDENEGVLESPIMNLNISTEKNETIETYKLADMELITKITQIIEQNIENRNFKLNNLSEKVYLSERQLRRKIRLMTGLSPKKLQQEIQLMKARNLFEEGAYENITAVAISVGMENVTRFSKMYIERFGKHPATYFTASK
jgi:signal transduction histidine kinase/DNA-binding response OmpR family regulator